MIKVCPNMDISLRKLQKKILIHHYKHNITIHIPFIQTHDQIRRKTEMWATRNFQICTSQVNESSYLETQSDSWRKAIAIIFLSKSPTRFIGSGLSDNFSVFPPRCTKDPTSIIHSESRRKTIMIHHWKQNTKKKV